tara:strand:+ start:1101 stop:1220 length:120 start_codon:yes stop_codon:yes gene_type:complete
MNSYSRKADMKISAFKIEIINGVFIAIMFLITFQSFWIE